MEKINLTERATAHFDKVREGKRVAAVSFVEKSLIPHLCQLADNGTRFTVIAPPSDLYLSDVCDAINERVECSVNKTGFKGRLSISW